MTPLILILIMFAMGAAKSHLRVRVIAAAIGDQRASSTASTLAHVMLWPLASALYLYNAIAAFASRRIKWRGIDYELKSPNETVIIESRGQKSEVRGQY
jgi:hypothetical protein